MFTFAVLGAGNIAPKFVRAARMVGCEIAAVASRTSAKAAAFSEANDIPHFYSDYAEMLEMERVDCAYIATVPSSHYELTMLCLEHAVPVVCEKAMFRNSKEAESAFSYARSKKLFIMEALWSKFLPANVQAKRWLTEGRIGRPVFCDASIGFRAPDDDANRYFNPALGGGPALDITVYAYEITAFMLGVEPEIMSANAAPYHTGVNASELVAMKAGQCLCTLRTSFVAPARAEGLYIAGEKGRIVVPHPHYASEAFLYDDAMNLIEHFEDKQTENGFVYEIQEAVDCITAGRTESGIQPPTATIACAKLFDMLVKY